MNTAHYGVESDHMTWEAKSLLYYYFCPTSRGPTIGRFKHGTVTQ